MPYGAQNTAQAKAHKVLVIWAVILLAAFIAMLVILLPELGTIQKLSSIEEGAKGSLAGYYAEAATKPADNITLAARNLLRRLGANDPKGKKLYVDCPPYRGVNPLHLTTVTIVDKNGKIIQHFDIPDGDEVVMTVKLCRWAKKFGKKA